jgi:hypothetical protein
MIAIRLRPYFDKIYLFWYFDKQNLTNEKGDKFITNKICQSYLVGGQGNGYVAELLIYDSFNLRFRLYMRNPITYITAAPKQIVAYGI